MEKKFLKFFQFASEATQWFVFVFFVGIFLFALFQGEKVHTAPAPKHTPNIITYQGKVMENNLAVTTTKAFGFFIFDASTGGNLLYTASGTLSSTNTLSIVPSQGIFSVDLGGSGTNELTSSTFSNNTNIYLEVWVGGTKLTPRKQLTAAPFALNSQFLMGITATTTSSGLYIPHSDSNGNFAFTGTPQSSGVGGGVIYVNPGSADNEETLFGVAVNGAERFRVDEDGDVWVNGSATMNTSTLNGDLIVKNGTNYVLYADRINQRVGIASSSPSFPLSVVGQSYFSATSTVQDISVLDGIVLGGTKKNSWSSFAFLASDQTFTGVNTFSGNNIFTGTNSFSATTTLASTTLNGNLNVDSGTFYVDALNNRVGVNSSTPGFGLSVGGMSYFSQTSTFEGVANFVGRTSAPLEVGSISNGTGGLALDGPIVVSVRGNYAYVNAKWSDRFHIFDISNEINIVPIGSIANGTNGLAMNDPNGLFISGNYAYITSVTSDSLCAIDISEPSNPTYVDCILNGEGSAALDNPKNVFVSGNYAYVASASSNALEIIDVSNPYALRHVGKYTHATYASGAGNVYVSGKYAYIVASDGNRMTAFDVSDPVSPKMLSSLAHGTNGALLSYPTGIYVSGRYAYVSSYLSDAIEIVDVSNPNAIAHAGKITNGTGGASLSLPTIAMAAGDYLYVATSGALEILNISSSTAPVHYASLSSTNFSGATSVFIANSKAYIAGFTNGVVSIVDVQGINVSNAKVGVLTSGGISASDFLSVDGSAYIKNGLTVGNNGLAIGGDLSLNTNTTTMNATNTISFSNTARFLSIATTTRNHLFTFDTTNNYSHTASSTYLLSVRNNGLKAFSVASNGDVAVSSTLYAGSATIGTPGSPGDLAERVDIAVDDTVEPGDVVIVDSENSDTYRRSQVAYEQSVAGVISTNPSLVIGFGQTQNTAVMALVGRVPIKVSTENGPIRRGDVLVTASSTGYAMRYDSSKDDDAKIVGIIGVALESLETGQGKIMGLVRTGWVNSRHKTIADIQQELLQLAEAQSASQSNGALNVVDQNGQLTFLNQDLDANGKSIFNIGRLAGKDGKWEVDADGRFITRLTTSDGEKSLYSLQSGETEYVFSGSAQLQGGVARVDFDTINREIIDPEKSMKINITLTSEANGVYISGKDGTGFVVKELQNGTSNASFDYVVIATRKMVQENVVVEPVIVVEPVNNEGGSGDEPVPPSVDESSQENLEPAPPVDVAPPLQEVVEEQSIGGQDNIVPEGEASEPASP